MTWWQMLEGGSGGQGREPCSGDLPRRSQPCGDQGRSVFQAEEQKGPRLSGRRGWLSSDQGAGPEGPGERGGSGRGRGDEASWVTGGTLKSVCVRERERDGWLCDTVPTLQHEGHLGSSLPPSGTIHASRAGGQALHAPDLPTFPGASSPSVCHQWPISHLLTPQPFSLFPLGS